MITTELLAELEGGVEHRARVLEDQSKIVEGDLALSDDPPMAQDCDHRIAFAADADVDLKLPPVAKGHGDPDIAPSCSVHTTAGLVNDLHKEVLNSPKLVHLFLEFREVRHELVETLVCSHNTPSLHSWRPCRDRRITR